MHNKGVKSGMKGLYRFGLDTDQVIDFFAKVAVI